MRRREVPMSNTAVEPILRIFGAGRGQTVHVFMRTVGVRPVRLGTVVAWHGTNFIFGPRAGASLVRAESLLHAYTRHVGRKSRYKQQHTSRVACTRYQWRLVSLSATPRACACVSSLVEDAHTSRWYTPYLPIGSATNSAEKPLSCRPNRSQPLPRKCVTIYRAQTTSVV